MPCTMLYLEFLILQLQGYSILFKVHSHFQKYDHATFVHAFSAQTIRLAVLGDS